MKIIIRNCNIELQDMGSFHQEITDSFSEYFKDGYVLKADGSIEQISNFSTFYKIPVSRGTVIISNCDIAVSSSSGYRSIVTYGSDSAVINTYKYNEANNNNFITVTEDGYVSIVCSARSCFSMYTSNCFEGVNSDLYVKSNKALKNDGSLADINGYYTIYEIPVEAGDTIMFSATNTVVAGTYRSYVLMDANNVTYDSSRELYLVNHKIVVEQNGYFSCMSNGSPLDMYADIIE